MFETAATVHLADERVWLAGDWHGNAGWVQTAMPAMRRADPDVRTILHVGDFWPDDAFCISVDYWAAKTGIERVLITLGNHEPWRQLVIVEEDVASALAARISETVWILPRPFRYTIGGRSVLSLGGAASVDSYLRQEGRDWWSTEVITDQMVEAAIAGGPADLMITHETPEFTPVTVVRDVLSSNPHGWLPAALAYSADSRAHIQTVWDAVRPQGLVHGTCMWRGKGRRRTVGACSRSVATPSPGNAALLNLADLTTRVLTMEEIRRGR